MNGGQEQFIEQQPMDDGGGYVPVGSAYPSDVTKFMLETKKMLEAFEHQLRGEELENGKWVHRYEAVMNEKGVKAIIRCISPYANKNTFLSNFEKQEVYDLTLNFSNNILQLLFNNGEDWGLDWDSANQGFIVDTASDIVFFSLARGQAQGEKHFLGSSTQIRHNIQEMPRQQKDKKFGFF